MTEKTPNCTHEIMMAHALGEAKAAVARNEVPIGAILIDNETDEILSQHGNRTIEASDPTAHAEILCIREACEKLGSQRIPNTTLYVTLEPCTMCAAAIAFARINHLVIGAVDPKGGGVLHGAKFFDQKTCHHKMKITADILSDDCSSILKKFFKEKRQKN